MEGRIIRTCRHCQQSGHLAAKCPNKKKRSMNLFQEIAPPTTTFYELAEKLLRKTNHAAALAESRIVSDADFQLPKKKKKKKGAKLSVEEAQRKIEQHIHNATLKAYAEAQRAQDIEDEHRSQRLSQLNYTQQTSEAIPRPSLRDIMSEETEKPKTPQKSTGKIVKSAMSTLPIQRRVSSTGFR
jgi:hypothetical protein